jgi:hypothetical protein
VKFGGYIRHQHYYKQGAATTLGPFAGASGRFTRTDLGNDYVMRTRAVLTWDTRQSTSYGTLRTYWLLGFSQDSPGAAGLYATRAFIQFAGFTFGKATSFFELHNGAAYSYMAPRFDPTTGDSGWQVAAYTAQFGNGVSATFSVEEPRRNLVTDTTAFATTVATPGTTATGTLGTITAQLNYPFTTVGVAPGNDQLGPDLPDFVSNWRVDQTWGSAMFSTALHKVGAGYYGVSGLGAAINGHPSDKWGWAALAAIVLRNAGCPGCVLSLQGVYTEGAARYAASIGHNLGFNKFTAGANLGVGWISEGVFAGAGSSLELTKIWSAQGAYEYVWNPNWKSSIYANYAVIDYNSTATGYICASAAVVSSGGAGGTAPGAFWAPSNCNPDFKHLAVGHRTQWTPVPGLYMGVDVLYEKLYTAFAGTASVRQNGAQPAGTYNIVNQDNWSITWRIHRDVVP